MNIQSHLTSYPSFCTYHIPLLSESENHQSDPHIRRTVLQTGPLWNFNSRQSTTVTLLQCARQDRKLQMEMEKRGGDEERRPDVALCPLTWSHVRLERKRRRTGSGKRDVEQILLMGEKQCDCLIYLKMLESKRSLEPQEGDKRKLRRDLGPVRESTLRSSSFSRSSSRFPPFAGRWKCSDRAPVIISHRLDEETEPALAKTS